MGDYQPVHASPHNNKNKTQSDLYRLDVCNVKSAPEDGKTLGMSCRRKKGLNTSLIK